MLDRPVFRKFVQKLRSRGKALSLDKPRVDSRKQKINTKREY